MIGTDAYGDDLVEQILSGLVFSKNAFWGFHIVFSLLVFPISNSGERLSRESEL
jgi:hypothetical protein